MSPKSETVPPVPPIELPVDIDPPAHEHSHATTDCGPIVGRATHDRCPGWLSGVYGLVACDCWCHARRRLPPPPPFCTECSGPFTEEQGGDPQYGGHWDTCPNRPKGPSEVTMLGEDDVLSEDD